MVRTEKEASIQKLVIEGIAEIDKKYGSDGSHYLPYHNTEHAHDVMKAAVAIGKKAFLAGKITSDDVGLLELAACYHDVEHGLSGNKNEYASIDTLVKKMQAHRIFTKQDIAKVTAMIAATIVQPSKAGIVQSATNNYLTQILADADLSAFGKLFDVFWDRSNKYLHERLGKKFDTLSTVEKVAFIADQIKTLQNHTYYTHEAENIYCHKRENCEELAKMAKRYSGLG